MEKYSKIVNYEDFQKDYIIDRGIYRGHEYVIRWTGTHPCAYVRPKYYLSNEQINNMPVHGGISFCGNWLCFSNGEIFKGSENFIGWDYAHAGDYWASSFRDCYNEMGRKKYTYEEIMKDVKKAIDYLCELEKK